MKFKRNAATHVLVIMISPEERSSKPYALPVQYIACRSLKDADVQTIANRTLFFSLQFCMFLENSQ